MKKTGKIETMHQVKCFSSRVIHGFMKAMVNIYIAKGFVHIKQFKAYISIGYFKSTYQQVLFYLLTNKKLNSSNLYITVKTRICQIHVLIAFKDLYCIQMFQNIIKYFSDKIDNILCFCCTFSLKLKIWGENSLQQYFWAFEHYFRVSCNKL